MANKNKYRSQEKIQPAPVSAGLPLSQNFSPSILQPKIILFLFAFLLYANTLSFDYALDDKLYITHNEFTKKGFGGIKEILTTDLFVGFYGRQKNLVAGGRYRPLPLVTFAIEYQLFGKNPFIAHLVNAFLYGFTAILLFIILFRLFPPSKTQIPFLKKFQSYGLPNYSIGIPFLTTLIFVAHPLHTEIVANIKSRDELMSFLGALAALFYTIKYMEEKKIIYLLYSSLCFFVALLCKETTVTFIAIIPLTIYFFSGIGDENYISESQKSNRGNGLVLKIFLSASSLIFAFIIYLSIRYAFLGSPKMEPIRELMNDPFIHATAAQKFGTIFFTMGLYIRLLFFPHPLTHDYYPWHPLAEGSYKWIGNGFPYIEMTNPKAFLPLLFYLGIFIYALTGLKKKSIFSYGILFFLGTFLLTSNLIFPIGTFMNERFMYIPSLGFCLILIHLLLVGLPAKILNPNKYYFTLFSILTSIILFYSSKTITRNYAWKNDFTLATTDVKTSPNSAKVRMSAGGSMLDKAKEEKNPAEKQKLLNESIKHLYRSLELYPTYIQPMLLMGNAYYETKDYNNSILFFENCLKIDGNYEYAVNNLLHIGDTCTKMGMFELAIKSLNALVAQNKNVRAYQMLGELYGKNLGNLEKSAETLEKALEIEPRNTNTLQKLGVVHAMKGEPQKAIEIFNKALEIEPLNAHIMMNLGITLNQIGQKEKGQEYLDKAFKINPDLRKN